jgi:ABC-2 type transport system ATP-binding protein
VIHVEHLCKDYGPTRALDDVSFDIAQGEVVGLLGPNGAGKTTAMRILTGYMPPSDGQASIAGYDVFEDSLEVRARIGYLPESVPLYDEMTVRAYLAYMADLRRVPDRAQAVQQAMEACHIAERGSSPIGHLSKGLRQRVGLAQAIVHDPEVLILDEPTIGLDPKQIREARQLIQALGAEHTVILSSHILPEVSQTCSRILILHGGRLVAQGTPDELMASLRGGGQILVRVHAPTDERVPIVLGSIPGVSEVQPQEGDAYTIVCTPDTDVRPQLAQAIVQHGWELIELRAIDMSLEDIFLQLTVDEPDVTADTQDITEGTSIESFTEAPDA